MSDRRLIEEWLPIAELGIESTRERTPMSPFPAPNRLHVWWARRPLVASRAAVLASLLPAGVDREKFKHLLGIHGDPVAAQRAIDEAKRAGKRIPNPHDDRAFNYAVPAEDRAWLDSVAIGDWNLLEVLDPTAGGGSIPLETARIGLSPQANDLNPVAALIMQATIDWPLRFSRGLESEFGQLAKDWRRTVEERLGNDLFIQRGLPDRVDTTYLWARTVRCVYCYGLVPLSPNWRLARGGIGVRLQPHPADGPGSPDRVCSFDVVATAEQQSPGTVKRGTGICPYADCRSVIDGDEIKRQAQDGKMGEQLFAVVYKERVKTYLKSGERGQDKWERRYRAPRPEDDTTTKIRERLDDKLPIWEAMDVVPNELIPQGNKTREPHHYGMPRWQDLFSPRQLLCHGTSAEVYREMLAKDRRKGRLTPVRKAAYGYLGLTLDTVLNYNSRGGRWDNTTARVRSFFDLHNYATVWSFGEMACLVPGLGLDWAIDKTAKCIKELIGLLSPTGSVDHPELFVRERPADPPYPTITCKSADSLDHIEDDSVDAIVMDPPWEANVMYSELADFFYVWLKRTAGHVFPDLFRGHLTNKEDEAVANVARFKGQVKAKARSIRDYQQRMSAIFAECRRTLKPDGIMTLMFTHKAAGAWDALTTGLMEAGLAITASWPVNTEAPGSMHIKDKAAANSTVFLVCRPRRPKGRGEDVENTYWEDIEPVVAKAVRERVSDFQEAGIRGVDLYLASFGPALEEFSRHWPLRRGTPREKPERLRRQRQVELFEEEWDPYEATPEDALDVARREVKRWRMAQLADLRAGGDIDPPTAFFILAWDTFEAPKFSYDEALKLARAVGVDIEHDVVGHCGKKEAANLLLWDSSVRAAKGALGPPDGSRGMIDAIHHAANLARMRSLTAAQEMLTHVGVDQSPRFLTALEAMLEVLPLSRSFRGFDLGKNAPARESASRDFKVLEGLRRLAFSDRIDEPERLKQLKLWRRDRGA